MFTLPLTSTTDLARYCDIIHRGELVYFRVITTVRKERDALNVGSAELVAGVRLITSSAKSLLQ
jgi:hypothetical protein